MKKTIFSLLTLCAIMVAGSANAQNTDLTALDNIIYLVPNSSVTIGKEGKLSFWMKNTADIRGFECKLYLPEGVTVAKSAKGKIQGSLSESRLPEEDEHTLSFSEHDDDGAYIRVLCGSEYEETFTGNDGELFTLQVNVASNMMPGTYPVVLKYEKLSENDIRNFYEHENITTVLNVTLSTGISSPQMENGKSSNGECYNLAGQRMSKPTKGVNIQNGRKVVIK